MNSSSPFFIHIGFHKTATTWLQNNIFSEHPQIQYLGKAYPDHPSYEMSELKDQIISEADPTFSVEQSREKLHSIIDDKPLNGFRIHGISYEGLSAGNNWFGGRTFYVADRLSEVFSDFNIKILMGIREQRSMIESMYSEYVKLGGSESIKRLLFSPFTEADDLLDKLKYRPMIEYYRKKFGSENVKVFVFEKFKNCKEDVLRDITDFLGISEPTLEKNKSSQKSNARLSSVGLGSMRLANHFFFGPLNNLSPITFSSYLFSHLLRALDYNTQELQENVKRNHEAAYRFEQDRRIQNQIRHHVNNFIETIDSNFFQDTESFHYELPDEIKSYLTNYYRDANEHLQDVIETDIEKYDYPL